MSFPLQFRQQQQWMYYLPTAIIIYIYTSIYFSNTNTSTSNISPYYCFSPYQVVRQLNFLSILLAPIQPPSKPLLLIIELLHLLIVDTLLKYNGIQYWSHKPCLANFITSYLFFNAASIGFSTLFFYLFNYTHSLLISHAYHDCAHGLSLLIVPMTVWSFLNVPAESKPWNIALLSLSAGLIFLQVMLNYSNLIAIVALIVISSLVNSVGISKCARVLRNNNNYNNNTVIINQISSNNSKTWTITNNNHNNDISKFKKCGLLVFMCICICMIRKHAMNYNYEGRVGITAAAKSIPPPHLVIIIPTVSRKGNPGYLAGTLSSIIHQLPQEHSNTVEIHVISYDNSNQSGNESAPDSLQSICSNCSQITFTNGAETISTLNEQLKLGSYSNDAKARLRLHVAASLNYAYQLNHSDRNWIMLHEDDFHLCPKTWNWIMHTLTYVDAASSTSSCGLFLATGGAGLIINRSIVPDLIKLLTYHHNSINDEILVNKTDPSDVLIQNCLRGKYGHSFCSKCYYPRSNGQHNGLFVSSNLVFEHRGFISSLSHSYDEKKPRWTCGWFHPFNGDPDVTVLHTDVNY